MSLDDGKHRDSSQSSGDVTDARLVRLDSSNGVRKARTAEVTGAADWQSGQQDLDRFMTSRVGIIQPHRQAGIGHACGRSPPTAKQRSTELHGRPTSKRFCGTASASPRRQLTNGNSYCRKT
jgi:hypothetical protein